MSSITSPSGTKYNFSYNSFGRTTDTKIGTRVLSSNVYDDAKGLLDYTTYGNGTVVDYSYDALGRLTDTEIDGTLRYQRIYDGSSRLIELSDVIGSKKIKYDYDILDRAVGQRLIDTATNKVYASLGIRYDNAKNRVSGYDVNIEGFLNATDFVYGENKVDPDIITAVKHNNNTSLTYGYDNLNRLTSRTLAAANNFTTEYTYVAGRTKGATEDDPTLTTTLVKTVKNGNDTLEYTYDNMGNITSVSKNGTVIESYTYDSLNQLTHVTYNTETGTETVEYRYLEGGNIRFVIENGAITDLYSYSNDDFRDLLIRYNRQTINYDEIGNPLNWRDNMQFSWADGRKLSAITKGTDNISYTYNSDGLRTSKSINGVTTDYYWLNGMLQAQKTGSEYLVFLYDENGTAYGLLLKNGTTEEYYYYVFNAQGDVIGILDNQGAQVVEYIYNPWGEILSTTGTLKDTIGQKNPLRYRGYYYDAETGFYYLNSRYYDPEVGRFINADGQISGIGNDIRGYNMFAYCFNNPVNMTDENGNWPKWKDVVDFGKKAVDFFVHSYINTKNPVAAVIYRTLHYNRNILNKNNCSEEGLINQGYKKVDEDEDKFHQNNQLNGESNRKYVIGKWFSSEVVYYSDGTINNTPEDEGTFNIYSGNSIILDVTIHGTFDVIPYMIWGNRADDSTTIIDRVIMIFK